MFYFTASGLRKIHDVIIHDLGGMTGVLSPSLLESAAQRPRTVIRGKEPFEGCVAKASSLAYAIATWHPFIDGNKRTALVSLSLMLYINDIDVALPVYVVKYIVLVAKGEITEEAFQSEVKKWSSKNRIVALFKSVRYSSWTSFQMWLLARLGRVMGYWKPFDNRLVDWLAAGDPIMLRKTIEEYSAFRERGYPKGEGNIDLEVSDLIEA